MKVLKLVVAGFVIAVVVFIASLSVGYFVGKSPQFENKMNALVEEKEQRDKAAYDAISDEKKKELNDAVFDAFAEGMKRHEAQKIAAVEADGTKVILTLPYFLTESLNDKQYVCETSAPKDFRQQVNKYKNEILVEREPYFAFQAEHPECYEVKGRTNYFDHDNPDCEQYASLNRKYSKDLDLLLDPAEEYVLEYCEAYY